MRSCERRSALNRKSRESRRKAGAEQTIPGIDVVIVAINVNVFFNIFSRKEKNAEKRYKLLIKELNFLIIERGPNSD